MFIATLLYFWQSGGRFMLLGAPPPKVNCLAQNFPEVIVHKNDDGTAREEEADDWRVTCSITVNDKKVFDEPLALAHPTAFREAMDAIDIFRKQTANQILKKMEKEKQK